MKTVDKKILPNFFEDVKKGIKTFEVRKDEDDIQVGDILFLEEWKDGDIFTSGYTGRCIRKKVKYVLRDIPQYGLQEGYCIIGLEDINNGWIPCSERLPEDDCWTITCDKEGNIHIFFYASGYFRESFGGKPITEHNERFYVPIAWMPLPDPYIEK